MTSAKRPGSPHYLRNNNQNGGQFFAWTDGDPVNPGPQWVDLGFRTYTSVPEPVSIVLVAAGMGPKAKKTAKKKTATNSSKKKTGPIRELAQDVLPGA